MARWYTVPSWMLLGLIAYLTAGGRIEASLSLGVSVVVPAFIWLSLIYLLEYFHRDVDGRPKVSFWLVVACALPVVVVSLLLRPLSILAFLLMPLTLFVYSSKVKPWPSSPFVFIFRGLNEVLVFIFILMLNLVPLSSLSGHLPFILAVYLSTLARNLIGDLRDVSFDKYTFSKKFGALATYVLSFLLTIASIIMLNNAVVAFPLVIMLALTLLRVNAYLLHKTWVFASAIFFLNYLVLVAGQSLLVSNASILIYLAAMTYDFVPRKSNPPGYGNF